jgi:TonB-linked SusC/RagA family outer membrane protein
MKRNQQSIIRLLFCLFLLLFATVSFAQVTFNAKNQKIRQIIHLIEKNSDYSFFYNNDLLDLDKVLTINVKNENIEAVLKQVFQNTSINYRISANKQIVLTVTGQSNDNQEKAAHKVSGVVTDSSTGETLPGVNIVIQGTRTGVVSEPDGKFSIEISGNSTALEFSFIGYATKTVVPGRQTSLKVGLEADVKKLDEVVIIGYGTMKKRDVTTAISTVSTQDIEVRPLTTLGDAIQGMAAGVQVSSPSGAPGEAISIRVRGSTSVLAGNDPLYVIDGLPTSDMTSISPQDIETIQVLKDASSAAIYGARAANGVVIITTKRGNSGKTAVSYNGYAGISYMGDTKVKALNTAQYRDLMAEISGTGTVPDNITTDTNWLKETFKTALTQNHQISISTGTEKNKNFISLGYLDQKGIIHPSEYVRYNIRMNSDLQLYDWLKVTSSVSYANSQTDGIIQNEGSDRGGVILSAINTPPSIGIWDPNNPKQYQTNPYQSSWESPIAYLSRTNTTRNNRLLGNANAEVAFTNYLKFKSNFGVDYNGYQNDQFTDPIRTSYGRSENGVGSTERSTSVVWLLENTLSFDKTFGGHSLSVMGGQSSQASRWDDAYVSGKDFSKTIDISTLNAANQITNAGTQASAWSIASFFGRVAYNYKSKYLITGNVRYDGSSKLATGHKWGLFPSVSAGWRITEEPFMSKIKNVMNDMKIRIGFGKNGNQNGLSDYAWPALYSFSRVTPTNPLSGPSITQSSIENSSLKWETTTQSNAGIDASFLNSLLTLSVDAYLKKTDGLLLNVPLPQGAAPVSYITRNDGQLQNWGMEFALSTRHNTKDFSWNAGVQVSFNRNKIKKLELAQIYDYAATPNNQYAVRIAKGYSLGTFYGYVSEGVDPETGNMIYKDLNNNGHVDPGDRTVIGHAEPNFIFGINGDVTYKNFSLSVLLQGSQGNDIFNASRIVTEGMFDSKNQSTAVLRRWERPGMETDIPKAVSDGSTYNVYNSTRFIEDGSYLRVKSMTFSYSFPKKWIRFAYLNNLMVYVTGNNLLTWTKYSGFDPEVNYMGNDNVVSGVDYGTYPQYQSVVFGVKVQF